MYYLRKKTKDPTEGKKSKNKTSVRRKPNLVKKLDKIFSLYVRLRDTMPSGYFVCISCGKLKPFEDADCGHFHSRTHMATRYSELNCHCECRYCNRFSADHLIGYQRNLIRKIGQGQYDWLNVQAHSVKKWSDFELEAMIKHYTNEVKRLSSEKGIKVSV